MKLTLTITASMLLLGALTALTAADQPTAPAAAAPAAPARKFTDAELLETLGWIAGNRSQLTEFGFTDTEMASIAKGFAAALAGKEPPFKPEEIGDQFSSYMEDRQTKAAAKQHAEIEAKAAAGDPEAKAFLDKEKSDKDAADKLAEAGKAAKADGEKFLADIKLKKGVVALPSGVLYETITAGTGDYPKATDTVKVNYTGTLINGTKFDSNADHDGGAPAVFALNQVIPGWTEGIQKVNKGGKIKLYIPSGQAYGSTGAPPAIPPDSALVFDVELLDINPAPAAAK